MILGIGTDLVDITRIAETLTRHGDRFITRVFAAEERKYTATDPSAPSHYAKRFAAKEAAAKALGVGITDGIYLHDIIVRNAPSGAPTLHFSGGALARLDHLAGGAAAKLHLSLSDERTHAIAFVIIEGLATNQKPTNIEP